MTDLELAAKAESCWNYAKSVGAVHNQNFRQWFENRARQLYRLNDSEVAQVWNAAIRMHS